MSDVDPGPPASTPAPAAAALSETPLRSFQLLLGTILLPGLAAPIVWAFAAFWWRRAVDPGGRRWARCILALALLDTVLVVAFFAALAGRPYRPMGGVIRVVDHEDRVMIGVVPDDDHGGPGARLKSVFEGGPAAEAGLAAGDVVVELGGQAIEGAEGLRRVAQAQEAGRPVAVAWRRGGALQRAELVPRWASELEPIRAGAPRPTSRRACLPGPGARSLARVAGVALLLVLLAVVAVRLRSAVAWAALALVGGFAGAFLAAGAGCLVRGEPGAADGLAMLWGSSLTIALVALVGWKRLGPMEGPPARMRWPRALALASWYALTGGARLGMLLVVLGEAAAIDPSLGGLRSLAPDGPTLALLAVPVVLIGPMGEELAFRGLLQPALTRRWGAGAAILATTLVFTALHWGYGYRLLIVGFLGAVLGWARVASGGLRAPILLHMLVNAVALLLW